jgi:hypothetical protein
MAITRLGPNQDITAAKIAGTINFKNLIINGDMSLAQRSTSEASITGNGYYTVDRMNTVITSQGTWTQSQSTDVPTGQGFATSLKMDCTTADASPASADQLAIEQRIEAQNLIYIKNGTSNAEVTTLSFWVKSNKTGTYTLEVQNIDANRFISKTFTISLANTWEKKVINIDADTSGSGVSNDNGIGWILKWWLGAGSQWNSGTLQTTWATPVTANRISSSQVNLADDTDNEWYITGVQLEADTSASDFEFLPFDVNLQRCQRYLQVLGDGTPYSDTSVEGNRIAIGQRDGSGSTAGYPIIFTQCQMRATPSITTNNVNVRQDGTNYTLSSVDTIKNFGMTIGFNIIASSALGTGESFQLRTTGSNGYIRFDAEL